MSELPVEAVERFDTLWAEALQLDLTEPTAVTLATSTPDGRPSVRTVLLKAHDASGFVIYTNMESKKGRQVLANPSAALCFFWQPLMKQVIVEGRVQPVSEEEADAYWATRARGSQVGAWASQQSRTMSAPDELERRVEEFSARYNGQEVPRPPHWSGFRIVPSYVEFWTAKPFRLHERIVYELVDGRWEKRQIFP